MSKRGPKCGVCKHRERAAIDLALASGVSVAGISARYRLGIDSVYRHRARHLPPQMRARLLQGPSIEGLDLDKLVATESQSWLANMVAARNRAVAQIEVAEDHSDSLMFDRAMGRFLQTMKLIGERLGELRVGTHIHQNILVQPVYVEMRVELVRALKPYPQAAQAVAAVLHSLESKAAKSIESDTMELAR